MGNINGGMREAVTARVRNEEAQRPGGKQAAIGNLVQCVRVKDIFDGAEQFNGLVYADLNRGHVVYNKSSGEWLFWAGHHWERDIEGVALQRVENVIRWLLEQMDEIYQQTRHKIAAENEDESSRQRAYQKAITKRIKTLRTERGRATALSWAATNDFHQLSITGDRIDQKPMLLACRNCVIDLQTGEARPGRPDDYLLRASPFDFLGVDQRCPAFEQFMSDITLGDNELQHYFQRLLGYSITGVTSEHVFPVFSGSGRNGKTVLIETIAHVLGPLATPIASELLMDQKVRSSAGPSPDIMALMGRRIVYASESDENRKFSPSMVKRLSGSDSLTGRNPHDKHTTTFEPSHKLFLLANDKPRAPGSDYAFWRRMHLVPFNAVFVDHEPQSSRQKKADKTMLDRLKSEAPGILAWLVRGCLEWQVGGGLNPPPAVRDATAQYQKDEDLIGEFVEACCYVGDDARATAKDLYASFCSWWEDNISARPVSQKKFGSLLGKRFERVPDRLVWYRGVGLLASQ